MSAVEIFNRQAERQETEMILKVKNNDGWSFFEFEVMHYRYEQLKKLLKSGVQDSLRLYDDREDAGIGDLHEVKVISLEKTEGHLRTIWTDRKGYIVNDQGKTIDRI